MQLRRMGAADRLRYTLTARSHSRLCPGCSAVYDGLARDPNSLANLDQDLPNYLQHDVPIFSLPQEWLWCATWCSAESKVRAKTIDLCNNPQTKIPKLDNAHAVIGPYWKELDDELKALESGVPAAKTTQTTAAGSSRKTEL